MLAQLVRVPDCGSGGHGVVAHTSPNRIGEIKHAGKKACADANEKQKCE